MTLTRQLAAIFCLALFLAASTASTAAAAAPAETGHSAAFYDRIMAILKEPPKLELPAPGTQPVKRETPIFGAAEVSKEQMANFIRRHNPLPRLTVAIEEIVELYWEEAGHEGIRPDLALAQALLETGFFRFGGDVVPEQNNFAGIGTTGRGARGAWFESPRIGVRAHIQHLLAYTTTREPARPIVDPRYELVRALPQYFAQCATWESLGGKWAIPGVDYGQKIVRIISYIKRDS
jgi:hypothetical protein